MTPYEAYVTKLEEKRRVTSAGVEFWTGRDLQPMLSYATWERFEQVIQRARMACESAGGDPNNHFRSTEKMVPIGSGAERGRSDWILSRYACYLIAMNADSSKAEVGYAQTYFAVQTRRQEVQDQLTAADKRRELRERLRLANKALSSAAKGAGVIRFGVFHDAGYKGLYGGLGRDEIKALKGIPSNEDLLDCVGRAELAANEFRATQAEEKLKRERVRGEQNAINTHHEVGREVRATIERLKGSMPEGLPREESLKKLQSARRRKLPSQPRLLEP